MLELLLVVLIAVIILGALFGGPSLYLPGGILGVILVVVLVWLLLRGGA